ncbi:hypothetical protein [Streptomyces sp. NPDC059224]|uniref:hypothetical protein n=1 Tax=Streptomyces sp. NPDC059224 TaxID=3346775 RepID=UPI0036A42A35
MASRTELAAPCSGVVIGSAGTCPLPRPPVWRRRPAWMAPGIRALAVMPSAVQRRVVSTANRTPAVLDRP